MKTEENNRMEALACIIADLKAENMMMTERVHQLVDDYNDVVRQLNGKKKRKDEDPSKQTLGEMMQMRDHCDMLKRDNAILKVKLKETKKSYNQAIGENKTFKIENDAAKRYMNAVNAFMEKTKLYVSRGTSCPYISCHPAVCSTNCLECGACLQILENCGVVCLKKLQDINVSVSTDE